VTLNDFEKRKLLIRYISKPAMRQTARSYRPILSVLTEMYRRNPENLVLGNELLRYS